MKLKRKPEKRDLLNIIIIICLAGLLVWVGIQYNNAFGEVKGTDLISSAENLRGFIQSYGGTGILIMTFLHAFHVIVSFIPAMLIQFAGSAIYGLSIGMFIGIAGVAAGTAVSFYISRLLGRQVVTLFISEKTLGKLEGLVSGDMSSLALLVLFIIPFPKDFIAYFIGLTNMKASKFFIISAIGRLPGMFVTSYLGAHIFDRNYTVLIAATVFTVAATLTMYFIKDRILGFFHKKREKGG